MTNIAIGVDCDPDIMAGEPCVAGTRIPTRAVRSFAEAGYSVDRILGEYPSLTTCQVADALAWEARPKSERRLAVRAILETQP